jgi:ribosomal protein S27E
LIPNGHPAVNLKLHPYYSGRGMRRTDLSEKHMILENSEFKIVCDHCGSLTIKPIDPAHAASETEIQCGRCNAVRGTLADLRALAHRGKDVFEF